MVKISKPTCGWTCTSTHFSSSTSFIKCLLSVRTMKYISHHPPTYTHSLKRYTSNLTTVPLQNVPCFDYNEWDVMILCNVNKVHPEKVLGWRLFFHLINCLHLCLVCSSLQIQTSHNIASLLFSVNAHWSLCWKWVLEVAHSMKLYQLNYRSNYRAVKLPSMGNGQVKCFYLICHVKICF